MAGWLTEIVLLTSHGDVHCLALNGAVAVVSCTVVSSGMAFLDHRDLQLCSLGWLTFCPQILFCVLSVPGECDVPCAFSHGADKGQLFPHNCLVSRGIGLHGDLRHTDPCMNKRQAMRARCGEGRERKMDRLSIMAYGLLKLNV